MQNITGKYQLKSAVDREYSENVVFISANCYSLLKQVPLPTAVLTLVEEQEGYS